MFPFNENNDPLNIRTFERVDDTKGYVQGNVVVVTLRANRIKNLLVEQDNELNIGIEQFINMAEQIKKTFIVVAILINNLYNKQERQYEAKNLISNAAHYTIARVPPLPSKRQE